MRSRGFSCHLCEIDRSWGTAEVWEEEHGIGGVELGLDGVAEVEVHWGIGGGDAVEEGVWHAFYWVGYFWNTTS